MRGVIADPAVDDDDDDDVLPDADSTDKAKAKNNGEPAPADPATIILNYEGPGEEGPEGAEVH